MNNRVVAPEWVVADRADSMVDDTLRNGGWGVSPTPVLRGASFTDFGNKQMAVPLGNSPEEKAVRLHEMLHARISPSKLPPALLEHFGVSMSGVRLAEEMRVNWVGRALADSTIGNTLDLADGGEKATAKKIVERKNWNDALSLYLTTYNTKVHATVRRALIRVPEWREAFDIIEQTFKVQNWKSSGGSTRYQFMNRVSTIPHEYSWVSGRNGEMSRAVIPAGFLYSTLQLASLIDGWTTNPPTKKGMQEEGVIPRRGRGNGANDWDTLRWGLTTLSESTSRFIGKRKRPAMTGKHPSRPDRLLTDPMRRIFREHVRGGNAVIVFDCSGSMGVTHEIVMDAVQKFAGATIAVYSTSSVHGANCWVVARNGRMISREEFNELELHQGNGVDFPMLAWAVKQKKTSKDFVLWVSDGHVTGREDLLSDDLVRQCAAFSRKHNIIGVSDCEGAVMLLDEMQKSGKVPRNKYCGIIEQAIKKMGD